MRFASDNTGPVHPRVMEALLRANEGWAPSYGNDDLTRRAEAKLRDLFEAPEAAVYLVATGTAANSLILSSLVRPFEAIFCTPLAHVHVDECAAPEAFTGGAKVIPVGEGARMTTAELRRTVVLWDPDDIHRPGPGAVTITQANEMGEVWSLDEIGRLAEAAHDLGMPLHMDGARFANACAALGCTPAEMSWKAGVDAVTFGGTKNGLMGVEAAVFFDPARAAGMDRRRKRAAHLFSKSRYLAAQIDAYLTDGLWHDLAAEANRKAARLADGLRAVPRLRFLAEPGANMIFLEMPRRMTDALAAAGATFGVWRPDGAGDGPDAARHVRLVCDWSISDAMIDRFVGIAARA